jgi:hypothetical protein
MKYAVELGSGAMIIDTKFNKEWFSDSNLIGEDTQIQAPRESVLISFQNKESKVKRIEFFGELIFGS